MVEHTDSDGFVDLGGYGFYVTEAVDMGGWTAREPVRDKEIRLDRETGEYSVIRDRAEEERIRRHRLSKDDL